jgi:hypothetical protein
MLLAVDQQLGEGAGLWVPPEGAHRAGAVSCITAACMSVIDPTSIFIVTCTSSRLRRVVPVRPK